MKFYKSKLKLNMPTKKIIQAYLYVVHPGNLKIKDLASFNLSLSPSSVMFPVNCDKFIQEGIFKIPR